MAPRFWHFTCNKRKQFDNNSTWVVFTTSNTCSSRVNSRILPRLQKSFERITVGGEQKKRKMKSWRRTPTTPAFALGITDRSLLATSRGYRVLLPRKARRICAVGSDVQIRVGAPLLRSSTQVVTSRSEGVSPLQLPRRSLQMSAQNTQVTNITSAQFNSLYFKRILSICNERLVCTSEIKGQM